jgi:hypothetical protein
MVPGRPSRIVGSQRLIGRGASRYAIAGERLRHRGSGCGTAAAARMAVVTKTVSAVRACGSSICANGALMAEEPVAATNIPAVRAPDCKPEIRAGIATGWPEFSETAK